MKANYLDIIEAAKQEPLWWDENGVPRFTNFDPKYRADIYANKVKLLKIRCQFCHKGFEVCISQMRLDPPSRFDENVYGDPPNVGCCGGGPSSTAVTIKVLQYWSLESDWIRCPEKEVSIPILDWEI